MPAAVAAGNRAGFQVTVEPGPAAIRLAAELQRRRDEAFHEIAFRRPDIGFVDIDAVFFQQLFVFEQLPVMLHIQADYRALMKIQQRQGPQFKSAVAALHIAEHRDDPFALFSRNERDRWLQRQTHMLRAIGGRQPEFDLGPGSGIAPVSGQNETLLLYLLYHLAAFACISSAVL